jgi:ABC-type hemin transport system ATPase subunit
MPGDDTTLLEVSELRVSVPGRVLVDRLDMTLQRGEFIAVLGRNGTGKTLSLLTLAGAKRSTRCAGSRSRSTWRCCRRTPTIFFRQPCWIRHW